MSDLGVVEGIVCDRAFLDDRRDRALEVTTLEELAALQVVSPAQVTQVMQALAIARAFGVDQDLIGQVLRSVAP
jgi:UDP-N-acetylmuramoylalanine--D-glutamate ligase